MAIQQKITPHLWFDNNAEEAVAFYASIVNDARVVSRSRYGESGRVPRSNMAIAFKLEGQDFVAINGGRHFKFNEATRSTSAAQTQEEIDRYWSRLLAGGGQESQCGWLKDRADRVMKAMLAMKKIDIQYLKEAREGHWRPAASRASGTTRWRARMLRHPPGP